MQEVIGTINKFIFTFAAWCLSIGLLVVTERCRRNPQTCQDSFMGKNGATRSFVALRFLGRPDDARRAIMEDQNLRREYLLERYLWSLVCFIVGLSNLFIG